MPGFASACGSARLRGPTPIDVVVIGGAGSTQRATDYPS